MSCLEVVGQLASVYIHFVLRDRQYITCGYSIFPCILVYRTALNSVKCQFDIPALWFFLDFAHLLCSPSQMPIRTLIYFLGFVLGVHSPYLKKVLESFSLFHRHMSHLTNMFISQHYTAGEMRTLHSKCLFSNCLLCKYCYCTLYSVTHPESVSQFQIWQMRRPQTPTYYSVTRNTAHRVVHRVNIALACWEKAQVLS